MTRIATPALAAAVLCLLSETFAHGGQYRGPVPGGRFPGQTPGTGGPLTPGGRGITAGGPLTPDQTNAPDATRWQVWWELNKDPYLRAPELAKDPRSRVPPRNAIPQKMKIDVILPALKAAIDQTSNQDITSAAMIAMGKIGLDHPTFQLLDVLRKRLRRSNQEIRETAALAMGISKMPGALQPLVDLLHNTPAGRRMVGRDKVADRTRTFAAYGLGLLAHGNTDLAVKNAVYQALTKVLEDKEERDRDIIIGVLNGFRLLDPDPRLGSGHKRLLWTALATLEAYQKRPQSKSRQTLQAHVAPAIARLLGRGLGSDHQRVKEQFAAILKSTQRRHATLYQSTVIGMGRLLVEPGSGKDDATFQAAMRRHMKVTRDQLTTNFGLIAMAQIGGEDHLEHLLRVLRTGKRDRQGWAALALGLFAFHLPPPKPSKTGRQPKTVPGKPGPVRAKIGKALHQTLLRINNRDVRSAAALGLGLAGYRPAAADMRRVLQKYRRVEEFAGYLAMGLAMLDDKASGPLIDAIMAESSRRPLLMTQAALALGRLRHPGAGATLRGVLRTGDTYRTITLASTALAMGFLAEPGNVRPLISILKDTSNNKLIRAFAAAALGSMAENDPITWSSWIAMNMNYSATVETLSNGSSGILDIL